MPIERIDFELPEFARTVWGSQKVKSIWDLRIKKINAAWEDIERLSVIQGARGAALQVCQPENLADLSLWGARNNLVVVPVAREGAVDGIYGNATRPLSQCRKWNYRIVITQLQYAADFVNAWSTSNNDKVGEFLGYPECCRAFYQWSWVDGRWRDVALTMTTARDGLEPYYEVKGYPECNILLRYLGVRLVSHLPCSHYCEETRGLGVIFENLGKRFGYSQEMLWAREMLNWPVLWTSLHGISITTTPLLKIIASTDPLTEKIEIRKAGDSYPEDGLKGSDFPFRTVLTVRRANDFTDNGFSSHAAMDRAHDIILQTVAPIWKDGVRLENQKILDLGCGNGRLLERIVETVSQWIIPCGVEFDDERYQRANLRLARHNPRMFNCNLFDFDIWANPYGLALISVNRLAEGKESEVRALLDALRLSCTYVLFYSYQGEGIGPINGFDVVDVVQGDSTFAVLTKPKEIENEEGNRRPAPHASGMHEDREPYSTIGQSEYNHHDGPDSL